MRCHRVLPPLAAAVLALALMPSSPVRADILVVVNKAEQRMTVTVDGEPRFIWPVSTGKRGYDTPNGEFRPFRMERTHFSREWDDAPMPFSIFFTQEGHAIHGSYDARHLGSAASHGCVRLSPANAATLFALVKEQGVKNATVVLTGDIPGGGGMHVARREIRDDYVIMSEEDDRPPPRRTRSNTRAWRESRQGPTYYYYREQPYYAPRRSFGGMPYGW